MNKSIWRTDPAQCLWNDVVCHSSLWHYLALELKRRHETFLSCETQHKLAVMINWGVSEATSEHDFTSVKLSCFCLMRDNWMQFFPHFFEHSGPSGWTFGVRCHSTRGFCCWSREVLFEFLFLLCKNTPRWSAYNGDASAKKLDAPSLRNATELSLQTHFIHDFSLSA